MTVALVLPASGLVRVIYASRWGACVGEDLHHIVRQVVSRSAHNNRLADVTGLLLVHGGWFVQVLEGPVDGVRQTFARIAADPRHFAITVLSAGATSERLFSQDMAEREIGVADYRLLDSLAISGKFAPAQLDAERALTLLRSVGQARAA